MPLISLHLTCICIASLHYLPFLVNKLLWSFTTQTVHQLGVVASVAADQLGQQSGTSAGLSGADRGPGTIGDPTLQYGPGEGMPAVWRQQVKSYRSTAGTLAKDSHLFHR